MIDSVRVDTIEFPRLDTPEPGYAIHYNAFDADGNSLPGLGGYLQHVAVNASTEAIQIRDELLALVAATALHWIEWGDEYSNTDTEITLVFVNAKRYHKTTKDAHGINFQFRRGDDPAVAALLLVHADRTGSRIEHNYKGWIEDADMAAELDADIDALFTKAEELALVVNQSRIIRKVEKSWARSSLSS